MCHGAGGLRAQDRFGARSGIAPVILSATLLVLAGHAAAAAMTSSFSGDVVSPADQACHPN